MWYYDDGLDNETVKIGHVKGMAWFVCRKGES